MQESKIIKLSLLTALFLANLEAKELSEDVNLQKVVVSASGFEQEADSNLRNVISIEGKDLQNKGYTSLEQALERVAGINFVNILA